MSRIPTFKECADVLEKHGWQVKVADFSLTKSYETSVGVKVASIVLQQSEFYQSIWPSYISEGRNILESHILFIKEKDNAISDDGNCEELEKILHALLQSALSRLDLVNRAEFDAQCKVLARTRERLEQAEQQLAALQ